MYTTPDWVELARSCAAERSAFTDTMIGGRARAAAVGLSAVRFPPRPRLRWLSRLPGEDLQRPSGAFCTAKLCTFRCPPRFGTFRARLSAWLVANHIHRGKWRVSPDSRGTQLADGLVRTGSWMTSLHACEVSCRVRREVALPACGFTPRPTAPRPPNLGSPGSCPVVQGMLGGGQDSA